LLVVAATGAKSRSLNWRGVAASLVAALAAVGCGDGDVARKVPTVAAKRGVTAPNACPVTPPNHNIPPAQGDNPGADRAPYHGNGRLWTVLPPTGVIRQAPRRDGSIRQKFPWWRGVPGGLKITGRRIHAASPTLRVNVPDGYGMTGFQASGLIFPREGCWRVTASVGTASLSFVTYVASS
jgi:hypothetical protein